MPYYEYNQNNSGGSFIIDENVAHYVFIEADTAKEADEKAQDIGIYFDGCAKGRDCDCCGDRWYANNSSFIDEGKPEPLIYGEKLEGYQDMFTPQGQPHAIVYHANGEKEIYWQVKS